MMPQLINKRSMMVLVCFLKIIIYKICLFNPILGSQEMIPFEIKPMLLRELISGAGLFQRI